MLYPRRCWWWEDDILSAKISVNIYVSIAFDESVGVIIYQKKDVIVHNHAMRFVYAK